VAVQVVEAPAAKVVTGHDTGGTGPAGGVRMSVTAMFDSGTSPVLVTVKLYVTLWPAATTLVGFADLVIDRLRTRTSAVAVSVATTAPTPARPVAVTVFVNPEVIAELVHV
jgi:hypothetical protein